MFKSIHGFTAQHLCNDITMQIEISSVNTRSMDFNNVYMPSFNLECTANAFSYKGPSIWNSLPNDLKECTSLLVFKQKCKRYFMNVQY